MQRDLAARRKALFSEAHDVLEIAEPLKALKGVEFDRDFIDAIFTSETAREGIMEIDATLRLSAIYNGMQCDADREIAKRALKKSLGSYAHDLDVDAEQVARRLALKGLPALALSGQRVKENLRAAKATMDDMAASLK